MEEDPKVYGIFYGLLRRPQTSEYVFRNFQFFVGYAQSIKIIGY